jgi:uncharacterized phage-associated protein
MNTNAISVANYFIDLAKRDGVKLKQYGLMKRVYITHGLSLACLDRSAFDERFDWVEAWQHGPVIPSVYHTFKHNGNNEITEKGCILDYDGAGESIITIPELLDKGIKQIADAVWEGYKKFTDFQIIEHLHLPGTPWEKCYEPHKNNRIPDEYTKFYYSVAAEPHRIKS